MTNLYSIITYLFDPTFDMNLNYKQSAVHYGNKNISSQLMDVKSSTAEMLTVLYIIEEIYCCMGLWWWCLCKILWRKLCSVERPKDQIRRELFWQQNCFHDINSNGHSYNGICYIMFYCRYRVYVLTNMHNN